MDIRLLFWYLNVFLASGYSFNICACAEIVLIAIIISHVKL